MLFKPINNFLKILRYTFLLLLISLTTINSFSGSIDQLKKQIEDKINHLPSSTVLGMMIYNPLTQDTLISINHTRSMIPASNTKLFTTAAALSLMGSDFILSTQILTDDDDLSDGSIEGNVYIKGFGNSVLTSEDLDILADSMYKLGIKSVSGNIIGDDTFFDDIYTRDDWIKDEKANVKLPPISALVIDRNREIVRKKRRGRYRNYIINVTNPPKFAAEKLKSSFTKNNISVDGGISTGETPAHASPIIESRVTLNEIIKLVNKNSDNFLAECLFKTIGAVTSGTQGNSFYSTQAILNFIEENDIYAIGTSVVDGSGISRFDQITVGAIVGLLEKMYFDLLHYDDFNNSLSLAGIDGTLEKRMRNTPAEGMFRGKTGTLNGVSSLSGYLTTQDGDDYIISIIIEFTSGGARRYRDFQDEIIETLAGFKNENPGIDYQGLINDSE